MTEWQLPKESAVARGYIVSHNNNHCIRLQWVKKNWLVYLMSGVGLEAEALNG